MDSSILKDLNTCRCSYIVSQLFLSIMLFISPFILVRPGAFSVLIYWEMHDYKKISLSFRIAILGGVAVIIIIWNVVRRNKNKKKKPRSKAKGQVQRSSPDVPPSYEESQVTYQPQHGAAQGAYHVDLQKQEVPVRGTGSDAYQRSYYGGYDQDSYPAESMPPVYQ